MTIAQMLGQSGILTVLGMCVVFLFLIILVLSMNLLRIIVKAFHFDKDLQKSDQVAKTDSPGTAASADQGAVIAAIAAAVHEKESV